MIYNHSIVFFSLLSVFLDIWLQVEIIGSILLSKKFVFSARLVRIFPGDFVVNVLPNSFENELPEALPIFWSEDLFCINRRIITTFESLCCPEEKINEEVLPCPRLSRNGYSSSAAV